MTDYQIHLGDCVAWAKKYKGEKFHALLTDPPYHLISMAERFGDENAKPAGDVPDGRYRRLAKGFMGKTWDGGDVAFQVETWKSFKRIMYPGGFGMSFASSRGWHRLAIAIEDAGFVIHPSIFGWCYGSGFPKATNIAKQIDGISGNQSTGFNTAGGKGNYHKQDKSFRSDYGYIYESNSDLAKQWQGHRYGLQALKPALEPIIVFQKPYHGRPVTNITETGAGALNISQARIGVEQVKTQGGKKFKGNGIFNEYDEAEESYHDGRWPSNFYIDTETAKKLDEQSGISKGGFVRNRTEGARPFNNNGKDTGYRTDEVINELDGGASRFFFQVSNQIDENDPVYYCAKASNEERSAGLKDFPLTLANRDSAALTNAEASLASGRNPHPTVKPIDLCKYLATLLLPPDAYAPRRIFVPFAGVASEMIGCLLAGWDSIEGVELTEEYIPIAKARMEYWKSKPKQLDMFTKQEVKEMRNNGHRQDTLF